MRARKRFGQNFLVDPHIIGEIVEFIDPRPGERLVEIGPGRAALTIPVLERCPNLMAVELDRDLAALLRRSSQLKGLTLIEADALKLDFATLPGSGPLRIFGNLPYNISTPLLFHLLSQERVKDLHFMLQKEVAERLISSPGSRIYGRLSIMAQFYAQILPLLQVPNTAFRPVPKVQSAVVRLIPRPLRAGERALAAPLNTTVTAAFGTRRKTLRNSLAKLFTPAQLEAQNIDPSRRAETLTLTEYLRLARALHQQQLQQQEQQ